MWVIFSASSDRMSFQRSSRIIAPIVRWLLPDLSDEAVHHIVVSVRKSAHVVEYAVLAWLLWRALRKAPAAGTRPWQWSRAGLVLVLVAFWAATDEFHQASVPSRQGSGWDVLLDTSGGALGLFCVWVGYRLRERWRRPASPADLPSSE